MTRLSPNEKRNLRWIVAFALTPTIGLMLLGVNVWGEDGHWGSHSRSSEDIGTGRMYYHTGWKTIPGGRLYRESITDERGTSVYHQAVIFVPDPTTPTPTPKVAVIPSAAVWGDSRCEIVQSGTECVSKGWEKNWPRSCADELTDQVIESLYLTTDGRLEVVLKVYPSRERRSGGSSRDITGYVITHIPEEVWRYRTTYIARRKDLQPTPTPIVGQGLLRLGEIEWASARIIGFASAAASKKVYQANELQITDATGNTRIWMGVVEGEPVIALLSESATMQLMIDPDGIHESPQGKLILIHDP